MRPPPPLLLLLLLLIIIPGAVTPPVSSLLALPAPDVPALLPGPVGPPIVYQPREQLEAASPGRRTILSDNDRENEGVLGVFFNGTLCFVGEKSRKVFWELPTGDPLWRVEKASSLNGGNDCSIFPHEDGNFYEFNKDVGITKLNWTVEDFVDNTPQIKGSQLTVGSKTMTVYHVDADSGKLLPEDHTGGGSSSGIVARAVKKSLASNMEISGSFSSIVSIIAIHYSLNSSTLGKFQWSLRTSQFTAFMTIKRTDMLGSSHSTQYKLPIKFLLEEGMPYLPSVPNSRSRDQTSLVVRQRPQISSEMEKSCSKGAILIGKEDISGASPSFEHQSKNDLILNMQVGDHTCPSSSNIFFEGEDVHDTRKFVGLKRSVDASLRNLTSQDSMMLPSDKEGKSVQGVVIAGGEYSLTTTCREPISGSELVTSNNLPLASVTHSANNRIRSLSAAQSSSKGTLAERHFSEILPQSMFGILSWCFFPGLLILLAFSYLKPREHVQSYNQGQQAVLSKKKKTRRAANMKDGSSVSSHDRLTSSERGNAHADSDASMQINERHTFINLTRGDGGSDGRWIGRLYVTNSEIGKGSNGTVVLEGVFDGRLVAVKRLLRAHHDVAFKEIQNLIASDSHQNIVRLYGAEQDLDFIYIALERCTCSLSDLIRRCSGSSSQLNVAEGQNSSSSSNLDRVKGIDGDLELWKANGFPSPQLFKLMREVVYGLVHLHELGIIHRDMKPHNVLISNNRYLIAKLSDMGISKRLIEDMSSLSHPATGYGSSGWQAPEQLLHGRHTRAVDIFSLGCILFFCITKGKHPFGSYFERDSNILNNHVDLFLVDHMPEAVNLLSQLLDADPKLRPTASEVLHDPFFWSSETRLSFLRDTSDRIELEDRDNQSDLVKDLEKSASVAFGAKWGDKLDAPLLADVGRYRKYSFLSVRDLLRAMRNKLNHYGELSEELQEILGSVPDGFDSYFTARFPKLLIEVYKVAYRHCKEDNWFQKYSRSSLA